MPIQEQNIVFVASQIMDDVPEGGGAATGQVVPDGVMNNVFEDISDLDRAYGRFNLRKLFLAVRSLDTALYGGAKIVITETPTDPALSYTLFTTEDPFDTRTEAANAVAAYLYKGPVWNGVLHENHIAGMRAISVLQRLNTQLPIVGQTLCLVQDEGLVTEKEQYVRVITVSAVETVFMDGNIAYDRWVVRLGLSDTLRHDFIGHPANRTDSYSYTGKTRIRATTVADATRYCSSQPLTAPAALGDLTVRAASIFTQLVPSAQAETPLISQILNPDVVQTQTAGTRTVEIAQQAHTRAVAVTIENRRYNWIETLTPRPAWATLSVAYRSQGNWYTLRDTAGAGTLAGSDVAFGSGTVNYTTGDAAVTLGALPDADTLILYAWASPAHYTVRAGSTAINEAFVVVPFTLTELPVIPETVTLVWTAGGVAKAATANATGVISGDGAGTIDPITGVGELRLTKLPDRGSSLALGYDWYEPTNPADKAVVTETHFLASPITLNAIPQDKTVRFWVVLGTGEFALKVLAVNNGGTIETPPQLVRYVNPGISIPLRMRIDSVQSIGTISGAAMTLNATLDVLYLTYAPDEGGDWIEKPRTLTIAVVAETEVIYRPDGIAGSVESATQTQDLDALTFRLLPSVTDSAVPNSLRFTLGGKSYDDANGTLLIPAQGNLVAGSVDYDAGVASVTYWADGAAAVPNVTSLLTRYGQWTALDACFRTAGNALKPQSLSLVAVTEDGEQITGSADADGVISGTWMRGTCNYEIGTATIEFGQLSGAPPAWTPRAVDPGTIRYNAVAYSHIPLDADILGIDAVRLPSDGRVPIYRAGDVVQILHADTTTGTPAQSGGTGPYVLSCGRTRLAFVKITDATGAAVTAGYTLDRAAGTLSWESLAGLATPVTVTHTVGDLRLVTDVRIDGTLTLARPLSHNFPADESLVAACLMFGDRRARVAAVWDQSSWDGTWTDALAGSAATATLNTIDYPIVVTNEGCDTDRWLLRWTSTTAVELLSEKRGLMWSGSYPAYVSGDPVDIAPINPRTRDENGQNGVPYLTIPQRANGGGWSAGNVVRINTVGAIADFWIARSIQQSDEPAGDGADGCEIYALGNINRP